MMNITPIRDKIIGRMVESIGLERRTRAGLIIAGHDFAEQNIKPRWFEVLFVGPEQTDVRPGEFVLVPHGRWSRGLDLENTRREEDKIFLLDNEALLGVSDTPDD